MEIERVISARATIQNSPISGHALKASENIRGRSRIERAIP